MFFVVKIRVFFVVKKLIEQVFAPILVGAAQIAHDLAIDVETECLRFFEKPHPGLIRSLIPFPVVAPSAAGYEIVPVRIPAPRSRHDVVQCQFLRREDVSAILAGIMVAKEDIFARQTLSLEWYMYVLYKPDY